MTYGDWEIGELSLHLWGCGAYQSCYEVVESASRLEIGGVAEKGGDERDYSFAFICLERPLHRSFSHY